MFGKTSKTVAAASRAISFATIGLIPALGESRSWQQMNADVRDHRARRPGNRGHRLDSHRSWGQAGVFPGQRGQGLRRDTHQRVREVVHEIILVGAIITFVCAVLCLALIRKKDFIAQSWDAQNW